MAIMQMHMEKASHVFKAQEEVGPTLLVNQLCATKR